VDNPESTTKPVTPIEIGLDLVAKLYNLPQEMLPNGKVIEPVVAIPTTLLSVLILQIISAFGPELVLEFTI
jgi:hypothetical protein